MTLCEMWPPVADDDDEDPAAVERHEIQALERRRVHARRDREADLVRRARELVREVRHQVFDAAARRRRASICGVALGVRLSDRSTST